MISNLNLFLALELIYFSPFSIYEVFSFSQLNSPTFA